jgi:hypothetical protein
MDAFPLISKPIAAAASRNLTTPSSEKAPVNCR